MKPVAFDTRRLRPSENSGRRKRERERSRSSPHPGIRCRRPGVADWPSFLAPPVAARLRPKPRQPLHFRRLTPLADRPQSMVKRWAYRSGQRSFNWQSTAFVMRGLSVQLRPLALEKAVSS